VTRNLSLPSATARAGAIRSPIARAWTISSHAMGVATFVPARTPQPAGVAISFVPRMNATHCVPRGGLVDCARPIWHPASSAGFSRDAFFCDTLRTIGQTQGVATKTQLFRYSAERSGPKRPKQPPRRRRDHPVDTAQPGISATDRRAGANSTAGRNRSKSAAKKASYVLEDSRERPSRKSTRRARNRQKPDNNLKRRQTRKTTSAAARARQS
jgi:hypothetical protein